jgi:hypothetical protein
MDFQKSDEYIRAHWPAVVLMLFVVVPATVGIVTFLRPSAGSSQQDPYQAKLLDLEARIHQLSVQIETIDKFFRLSRDDENRIPVEAWATLGTRSSPTAYTPGIPGAAKGKPQ